MKSKISGNALGILKFLFVSFIVTLILLLILALLLSRFHIREGIVNGGIIFTYIFSCFAGGMLFSKRKDSKCYLWGALIGFLYYVVILFISMILNKEFFVAIPNVLTILFLCVFGGMLGGMLRAGK